MHSNQEEIWKLRYQIEKITIQQHQHSEQSKRIQYTLEKTKRVHRNHIVLLTLALLLLVVWIALKKQNTPHEKQIFQFQTKLHAYRSELDTLRFRIAELEKINQNFIGNTLPYNKLVPIDENMLSEKDSTQTEQKDAQNSIITAESFNLATENNNLKENNFTLNQQNNQIQSDTGTSVQNKITPKEVRIEQSHKTYYGFVTKAYQNGETIFVEVDKVLYYTQNEALLMAQKHQAKPYQILENGDSIQMIGKSDYIHNANPKKIILEMDTNFTIQYAKKRNLLNHFSLDQFSKIIKDYPLFVFKVDNGILYAINEVTRI